jgi:transaldolase
MLANKPKTKILVDGGDPEETLRVKDLIGFVDGQTTNPSLIAKNPEIRERIASGHTLSPQERRAQEDCSGHLAIDRRCWSLH